MTPEPFYTSPEADGVNWTAAPSAGLFTNGPFEVALDASHGILYSGNWGNGVLAFQQP